MTSEEALIMKQLVTNLNEREEGLPIVRMAQNLLAAHAKGQQLATLEYVKKNYEGSAFKRRYSEDWIFSNEIETNNDVWVHMTFGANGSVLCRLACNDGKAPVPCCTRSDVRALERLGLLVAKKKGEGE